MHHDDFPLKIHGILTHNGIRIRNFRDAPLVRQWLKLFSSNCFITSGEVKEWRREVLSDVKLKNCCSLFREFWANVKWKFISRFESSNCSEPLLSQQNNSITCIWVSVTAAQTLIFALAETFPHQPWISPWRVHVR